MASFDKTKAKKQIKSIFEKYSSLKLKHKSLSSTDGKLYELYVLSRLLKELVKRGFKVSLNGHSIKFQASPGHISPGDSHFDVRIKGQSSAKFKIYTNVEVRTLGSALTGTSQACGHHELDIVVVHAGATGKPTFSDVVLGIECKAQGRFKKSMIREVLGLRREIAYLQPSQASVLSQYQTKKKVAVPAEPPSELWLAFTDSKGLNYGYSPKAFGIELKHWQP